MHVGKVLLQWDTAITLIQWGWVSFWKGSLGALKPFSLACKNLDRTKPEWNEEKTKRWMNIWWSLKVVYVNIGGFKRADICAAQLNNTWKISTRLLFIYKTFIFQGPRKNSNHLLCQSPNFFLYFHIKGNIHTCIHETIWSNVLRYI